MAASRFLRSLVTTAKQSVIPSFLRSPAAGGRASFLRRLWPFTSAAAANNNNTGVPDRFKERTIHYEVPARKRNIRLFTDEQAAKIEGLDFEHWIVVTETPFFPDRKATRDEEIDYYIKTLAKVLGSEEEARKKIYSVYTQQHHNSFGVNVSEEVAIKINALRNVYNVFPDSYMAVYKRYPGEPFIDGQAVPYHPKYHVEYLYSLLPEDTRKKIRPPNFDAMPRFYKYNPPKRSRYFPPDGMCLPP